MKKIIGLAVIVFIVSVGYWLFHPIKFQGFNTCDKIIISLGDASFFEITNREEIDQIIYLVNSTTYRKPMRRNNEAPDNLLAVVQLFDENVPITDIILVSSEGECSFYINTVNQQLVAYDPGPLSTYILSLISIQKK